MRSLGLQLVAGSGNRWFVFRLVYRSDVPLVLNFCIMLADWYRFQLGRYLYRLGDKLSCCDRQ